MQCIFHFFVCYPVYSLLYVLVYCSFTGSQHLPYFTSGLSRLLHLPSAEAESVRLKWHPQKVTVTKGHVNCREVVHSSEAEIGIKAEN